MEILKKLKEYKNIRGIEKGIEIEIKHKIKESEFVTYEMLSSYCFPQHEVVIEKLIAEPTLIEDETFLSFRKVCRIYKVCLGLHSQYVYLITKEKKELGTQTLCLKKLDYEEIEELLNGAELPSPKLFGLKEKENISWRSIIQDGLVRFYKELDPIPFSVCLEFAKKYGLNNLIEDFLCENSEIDEGIKLIYKSQLLDYGSLKPELQKYSPHCIIITNTKCGKTYIGRKVCGLAFDSATSSNLLGFSTAEKTAKGSIDEQYDAVLLDDFSTTAYPEAFLDALPSLLEQGESRIGKGKQSLLTRSSSSFILTTNASRKSELYDLMLEFNKIITGLSKMQERIGSRFACVYFNPHAKEVSNTKSRLSNKDIKMNKIIVEVLFKYFSKIFSYLFENDEVVKWLNTPIPNYIERVKILCEKGSVIPEVSEFWVSHASGYRHIKGMALRLGFLEWLSENLEIIEKNFENFEFTEEMIKEILEKTEDYLTQVISLNLNSLTRLIDVSIDLSEFYKIQFNNLRQGYLKVLIASFVCYLRENPEAKIVPFEGLEKYIKEVATALGKGLEMYKFLSKLKQKLQNLKRINAILSDFGLGIHKKKDAIFLEVRNENVIRQLEFLTTPQDLDKVSKFDEEEFIHSYPDLPISEIQNFEESNPKTQKFGENLPNLPVLPKFSELRNINSKNKNLGKLGKTGNDEVYEKTAFSVCYFCKLPRQPIYEFHNAFGKTGHVCFRCAVEKLLPTPFKVFGSNKIPKDELNHFPREFIERCLKEGILGDLGEYYTLVMDLKR